MLDRARRRVATWTAWVAVVAVAGLSLALRRRLAEDAQPDDPAAVDEAAATAQVH